MTIEELEKKLTELDDLRVELREQIKELKMAMVENVKPTPPHPRWKPKECDEIYVICVDGTIMSWHWFNGDGRTVDYRYKTGKIFRTKAEAEFDIEHSKVLAEMQEWAGKWDDEFNLRYDETSGVEIFHNSIPEKTYGEMRFATKEDAINCIKAVGEDRIKKYYFMIPEEEIET